MGRDMGPILAKLEAHENMVKKMREFLELQGSSGNWNYDPYMHGMYNGMEFLVAMAEDREVEYKEAPAVWLADIDISGMDPISEEYRPISTV